MDERWLCRHFVLETDCPNPCPRQIHRQRAFAGAYQSRQYRGGDSPVSDSDRPMNTHDGRRP